MKKFLMAAIIMFPLVAHAEDIKPYMGLDYQHIHANYGSEDIGGGAVINDGTVINDELNGANIHAGVRAYKNFGVEAGYFRTAWAGKNIATGTTIGPGLVTAVPLTTNVQAQGVTLDVLGYIPVISKLEAIGTVGTSYTWTKLELSGIGSSNTNFLSYRIGGGAQYDVTDNVNVRGLVRYQSGKDGIDGIVAYTVGVNYGF